MIKIDYNAVLFSKNVAELEKICGRKPTECLSVNYHSMIINLDFGKTYYMYYKDRLIAFKIRAFSVTRGTYLLQTPNGLMWENLKYFRIFNKKEEYFLYLEKKCDPIIVEEQQIYLSKLPHFHSTYGSGGARLYNAYKWSDGYGKPKEELSYIYDVLFIKSGFLVYYKLQNKCYDTYEQCVKANLDGMPIEDFEEEDETTITITIKTETKPKIHILRFIED